MELRQLRYFVNAATTLSFTEASRLSNITQSTLSQQIKQLESELGVQLFHRLGKHIQLTSEGRAFLHDAKHLLDDERQSLQRLADMRNLQGGEISVGIASGLGISALFTDAITEYNRLYPHVAVRIHQTAAPLLPGMLRKHAIDVALSFKPQHEEPDLEARPLFATRLCAVVSEHHPLADHPPLTLRLLEHQRLVLPSGNLLVRTFLDQISRKQGIALRPAVEIDDLSHIVLMVRSGRWVTVLPDAAIHSVRGLVCKRFDQPYVMPTSILLLSGVYQRKAVTEFLRLLSGSARLMLQGKTEDCAVCGETFLV